MGGGGISLKVIQIVLGGPGDSSFLWEVMGGGGLSFGIRL